MRFLSVLQQHARLVFSCAKINRKKSLLHFIHVKKENPLLVKQQCHSLSWLSVWAASAERGHCGLDFFRRWFRGRPGRCMDMKYRSFSLFFFFFCLPIMDEAHHRCTCHLRVHNGRFSSCSFKMESTSNRQKNVDISSFLCKTASRLPHLTIAFLLSKPAQG